MKGDRQLRIEVPQDGGMSDEVFGLYKSFIVCVSPLEGDVFKGQVS